MLADYELCVVCGQHTEDHHEFQPAKRPSVSCVCDAGTWGDPSNIPAVCASYEGDGDTYCKTCEHDEACHD